MSQKCLNQMISKAFCINLYFSTDRWKKAQKQFAANGLNVERFNAINGKECSKKYPIRPGNFGCNLSHYLIIQIAEFMGFEAILVFEDDVVLINNFVNRLNKCLADLPGDWDMLMLGGTHREPAELVTENIYRIKKSFTTHAYMMRSSMYAELLEAMKEFDQPMDCLLTEFQKQYDVYVTNPPLAWQAAGYSTIEERKMDYDFIKTNRQ